MRVFIIKILLSLERLKKLMGIGYSALSYTNWLRPWCHYVDNNFTDSIFSYYVFPKKGSRVLTIHFSAVTSQNSDVLRSLMVPMKNPKMSSVVPTCLRSVWGSPQFSKWHHRAIRYFAVFAQRARPCFDKSRDSTSMERFSILL